ncbi:MAG TPA: lipopolysaccharide heptosyltransferase I [Ideonella sp.]|nr:lipopolysaccharide heptosyltransferase I [Ideonella sp.]
MRVLVVKLSSLGDVVHALPAVQDLRRARPEAQIDWLVEPAFAPLVRRAEGVAEAIVAPLRRWRGTWWTAATRHEFAALRRRLAATRYDAVVDLQGLTKSALLARLARLAPGGHRWGLGNRTEGAGWEPAARWLVDRPVRIEPHVHALDRSRRLVAAAFGAPIDTPPQYGLRVRALAQGAPTVAFVHGTSREDKLWPQSHWVALGRHLLDAGWRIALPQGNEAEQMRAELIAASLQFERMPRVEVWPTLALDAVIDRLAGLQGVIGVDSGLSHIAVALGLPHVQIYNFPTAWRTGPQPAHGNRRQVSVEGRPTPTPDAVEAAWRAVMPALPQVRSL